MNKSLVKGNEAVIGGAILGGATHFFGYPITPASEIAHWCETHYIDIVPHNPLGPVSAAACVALDMAVTNVGVQEMPRRPGTFSTDLFPVQIGWEDGYAIANETPGLGIEFDADLARSRRIDSLDWPPLLRRNDGAFTNW